MDVRPGLKKIDKFSTPRHATGMKKNSPFWGEGIRFECQGSGKCCTSRGSYGFVYMTLKDRRRMAAVLKMPTREFTLKYCEKTDGLFHLKNPELDCEFLEKARCTVYEGRPTQCRTWPFWPENMKPRVWSKDVAAFCPGIGKGRIYSRAEIETLMKEE